MKLGKMHLVAATIAVMALAAAHDARAANMLSNASFETNDGAGTQVIADWSIFGNTFAEPVTPLDGSWVAKVFGNFGGTPNLSGLFQDNPGLAGEVYYLSAWLRTNTGDSIAGTDNLAGLKLEFYDGSNAFISAVEDISFNGSVEDTWVFRSISAVAPAGTAKVRSTLIFNQTDGLDGGAVLFDAASLEVPEPASASVLIGAAALLAVRRRRDR